MSMRPFIHDDFLLQTDSARRLYHEYAAAEPILDYHTHLPPEDVANNRQFANLAEIWLGGDHYKWRALRANGVDETYITGDASPYDKFLAWSRTVPHTLRNPLYHWTHLELKRYFDIDLLLNEDTADEIWQETHKQLATPELSAHGILQRFHVRAVCTTDDPADELADHRTIAASDLATRIFPTFRPDMVLMVEQPKAWNAWLDRLATVSDVEINQFPDLLEALRRRHSEFHAMGGRLSDHSFNSGYGRPCDEDTAGDIFGKIRAGVPADRTEAELFGSFMMVFFGKLDVERRWTKQLHIGVLRNTNARRMEQLGPNTGFDSIGDFSQGQSMAAMLSNMERESALPKAILYNVNPADNYVIGTMIGNFQGDGIPGKIQFGSGWWYLDQKEGMEWQINALSNLGLLSRFVGMLTDSRSFMSYPRHEYFRRVLCNLLGSEIESGELPPDEPLVGDLVRRICYENASRYLELGV